MLRCAAQWLALWVVLVCGQAHGAEVRVAVAANFAAPMQRIASAFARDTGHTAVLSVGSTGKFYAQIINGAPFQVLLSADTETPARLEREGLAVTGSRFTYAVGRLVLWSKDPALVDSTGSVLRKVVNGRIAVADPKLAPYGAAARETMQQLGLLSAVQAKLVQGESIGQAYHFVASSNAAMGFVALSQVMVDARLMEGSAWIVPAHLHAPLRQDAVLLNAGKTNSAATALLAYLRSDTARAMMRGYGYEFSPLP